MTLPAVGSLSSGSGAGAPLAAAPCRSYAISRSAEVRGRGVHSGLPCLLRVSPAEPGAGIVFRRIDLPGAPAVPARLESVLQGELQRRTTLAAGDTKVFTIEHVLSAAAALGVWDLIVEMDSPEPPFLDGSAAPFVALLREAGLEESPSAPPPLRLPRTVVFADGAAEFVAVPSDSFRVTYFFTSDHPLLRSQSATFLLDDADVYVRDIASARTFCFVEEIEAMRRSGLIKGASLASAIVFGRKALLNDSLRFPDEPVRHKILDFIGDLALLGRPLKGHFLAWRSGHRSNALFGLHLKRTLGL